MTASRSDSLDSMTRIYAGLQTTCMLLQYAISIEMKRSLPLGMKMLGDYEKLRTLLIDEVAKMHKEFTKEEIVQSYNNTGFYKTIYSNIDDTALELNQKYFPMPLRPQGAEYACTEAKCIESALREAKKFFPSLYNLP
ncbi:MAG TPA: hypothetical protein VFT64_02000 [Rickettsiales bacterium]|nr:hypothetical protein [Rickettsiales bacterium]